MIKDLNAVEKSDPTSSGGLETAELLKVSIANEVMTPVTAVEGDLNHLQQWRYNECGEQWRSRLI